MSEADTSDLRALHDRLGSILEERVTELMTEIKTAQALTRQLARTDEEIDRQRMLKDKLEAELAPMRQQEAELKAATEGLQQALDGRRDAVARLGEIREELEALQAASEEA